MRLVNTADRQSKKLTQWLDPNQQVKKPLVMRHQMLTESTSVATLSPLITQRTRTQIGNESRFP